MKAIFIYQKILRFIILLILDVVMFSCLQAQNTSKTRDSLQLVFYNVENLFDTQDNYKTEDDEFTPNGKRYWTEKKYNLKLNRISQAIMALSNFNAPEIIGLCEIENRSVLSELIHVQLLKNQPYEIVHKDSHDRRGIDVALLYDTTKVKPIFVDFIPVQLEKNSFSRDVLYAKMLVMSDTLHLFLNHWPSRFSGTRETEHLRLKLAGILTNKCDSILTNERRAKIILCGDFNDEPTNESLLKITEYKLDNSDEKVFYNFLPNTSSAKGTIKYKGIWNVFDQFIVSSEFMNPQSCIKVKKVFIANQSFLFEKDDRYLGKKPFRNYNGFEYIGGYSDHLPVKLVLVFNR